MNNLEKALSNVPRSRIGSLPTPLERLKNLEQDLQHNPIFIKRDDLTGLGPGGNKIRSLEFLLAEALEEKCDLVVASGPVQSNLCTLTAACANRLNLPTLLVHNGDKPARLEGNLLLNELLGAESVFLGNVDSQARTAAVDKLTAERIAKGKRPYIVRNGATTGRGALGYASAILEIHEQCLAQKIENMTIFAPGGNGGVAAGLIYGNQLLGNPFSIVIISVEDDAPTLTEHITTTIEETETITGVKMQGSVSDNALIVDDFRGAGWGCNTSENSLAIPAFAKREGILVENVYTSKVLVGMETFIKKGKVKGPVCYLHTGGFGSLFSQY